MLQPPTPFSFRLLFLLLCLCSIGLADNDIIEGDSLYIDYPAKEEYKGETLVWDIDAHYKPVGRFTKEMYRNKEDLVNWAHEMSHAVSSQIGREFFNEGKHGYYLTNDRAVLFDVTLDVNIDRLRAALPEIHKKDENFIYKTYLKNDRFATFEDGHLEKMRDCRWIFDELTAYCNGCDARKELKLRNRQGSHKGGYEFIIYLTYWIKLADQNHKELPRVKRFLIDQLKRLDDSLLTEQDQQDRMVSLERDPSFKELFKQVVGKDLP